MESGICLAHTDKSTTFIRFGWEFGRLLLRLLAAAIRTLTHKLIRLEMGRIFKQRYLKMLVIRTATMLWMIWLLLMIKINDSKIMPNLKRVFQEDARCLSFL